MHDGGARWRSAIRHFTVSASALARGSASQRAVPVRATVRTHRWVSVAFGRRCTRLHRPLCCLVAVGVPTSARGRLRAGDSWRSRLPSAAGVAQCVGAGAVRVAVAVGVGSRDVAVASLGRRVDGVAVRVIGGTVLPYVTVAVAAVNRRRDVHRWVLVGQAQNDDHLAVLRRGPGISIPASSPSSGSAISIAIPGAGWNPVDAKFTARDPRHYRAAAADCRAG